MNFAVINKWGQNN